GRRGPGRRTGRLRAGLPAAARTRLEDHAATGRHPGRPGRLAGRTVRHHQGPDSPRRGGVSMSRSRAVAWLLLLWLAPGLAWAQGAHPFGVPESGAGWAGPDWLAALFGQVSAWQTHFYRQLTGAVRAWQADGTADRKSTRLNSSHVKISYAVF